MTDAKLSKIVKVKIENVEPINVDELPREKLTEMVTNWAPVIAELVRESQEKDKKIKELEKEVLINPVIDELVRENKEKDKKIKELSKPRGKPLVAKVFRVISNGLEGPDSVCQEFFRTEEEAMACISGHEWEEGWEEATLTSFRNEKTWSDGSDELTLSSFSMPNTMDGMMKLLFNLVNHEVR